MRHERISRIHYGRSFTQTWTISIYNWRDRLCTAQSSSHPQHWERAPIRTRRSYDILAIRKKLRTESFEGQRNKNRIKSSADTCLANDWTEKKLSRNGLEHTERYSTILLRTKENMESVHIEVILNDRVKDSSWAKIFLKNIHGWRKRRFLC